MDSYKLRGYQKLLRKMYNECTSCTAIAQMFQKRHSHTQQLLIKEHLPTLIGKIAKKAHVKLPQVCHQVCLLETKLLSSGHMKEVP